MYSRNVRSGETAHSLLANANKHQNLVCWPNEAIHASFCSSLLVGHWYGDVPISFCVLVHVEHLAKEMALCEFQIMELGKFC